MKRRFINTILVVVILVFGVVTFSSCSKKQSNSESMDDIKKKGYITIGLDDTFVPMGYKDKSGQIVGFDVDLAKEVCKRIGVKAKFQPIDWSMKETELNTKNIDLIWNGYTITPERQEKVGFTNPYLANRQVIIALSSSAINSKAELKGKKVAVQNGSSSLDAVNKEPDLVESFNGGEPVLFDTNNEALMDLEAGRVDAVVADEILARYYINERGTEKYKVLNEDFGKEEYGIGARKQSAELIKAINTALDEMKKDGTSASISEKWFGENIVK